MGWGAVPTTAAGVTPVTTTYPGFTGGLTMTRTNAVLVADTHLFDTTIADAKASPPAGWAWENAASAASAVVNSTVAGAVTVTAAGSATTLNSDCWFLFDTVPVPLGEQWYWGTLVLGDDLDSGSNDIGGFALEINDTWLVAGFQRNGATYELVFKHGGTEPAAVSSTKAAMNTGVAFAFQFVADGVAAWYSESTAAADLADIANWTRFGIISDYTMPATGKLKIGFGARQDASNGMVLSLKHPLPVCPFGGTTTIA